MILTKEQIRTIREGREQNYSYNTIATALNLSLNTVKSYGYRHGMDIPYGQKTITVKNGPLKFCAWCGKVIDPKGRSKYCSVSCRNHWHNNRNMEKARKAQD